MSSEKETLSRRAMDAALEASGGLAEGATTGLGLVLAGPPGALAGATVGPVVAQAVRTGLRQVVGWLTGRQAERVETVITVAAIDIAQRIAAGESLRDDGLFGEASDGNSQAAEIAEGVMQTAAMSYDQRKIPYFGHLLASIAFRQDISAADAHHLARLADRLSFRQLQCLALFARPESEFHKPDSQMLPIGTGGDESVMRVRGAVGHELMDLGNQGLYGQIDRATGEVETVIGASLLRGAKFNPGLTELGRLLFDTMRLDLIPDQELKEARDDLLWNTSRSRPRR